MLNTRVSKLKNLHRHRIARKFRPTTSSKCVMHSGRSQLGLKPNVFRNFINFFYIFRYWINKFPFHFALDGKLIEAIKRFSNLISTKGYDEQLQFFDISSIESYDWMRKLTTRHPLKSKQKIALAFDKLEPEVIARYCI